MSNWSQITKQIYNGVLIYSLCGVAKSIVDPINNALSAVSMFTGADSGWINIGLILSVAIICGYIMFFLGLKSFRGEVNVEDANAVNKVYLATIFTIIAYVVGCVPVIGFVGKIFSIVAFFLMLIGFSRLKKSETFPEKARKGASNLFTAMILSIVGLIFGWIPIIGGVIGAIFNIIGFILTIAGWGKISKAEKEG